MNFIRKHIAFLNKITLGAFAASWCLLVIAIPAQIATMAESHSVFLIYNAEEDCYDLVMDHHKDADENHFSDVKEHDIHSFHISCCYDKYVIKFKTQDIYHALTFEPPIDELWAVSRQTATPLQYTEHKLPPPATLEVLRVTRLLI